MKNKIHKILGVSLTLVIAMALVMGFVAPVAASPGETINEWYKYDYPDPGADPDGWFYDPSIMRLGEITEAVDGTLYVHVQRCVPEATFSVDDGTYTFTSFGNTAAPYTGTIVADMDGEWTGDIDAFLPTDFVAYLVGDGAFICISGTLTETNVSFEGSVTMDGGPWPSFTEEYDSGGFNLSCCGTVVYGAIGVIEFGGTVDGPGHSVFKSTDGGRTWEDTGFPGGWVADMAASSLDADILYVVDGHYVYKTSDAGDTWGYVKKDSLEEQLSGACGVPACCETCFMDGEECCPSCTDGGNYYPFTCPITSIDVTYDDSDNPYVFIGTRKHCSGLDLDNDHDFDEFPGEVYWIGEAGFPSNWSGLGLDCYRNGTYDALAVGCAPDWADTNATYVVVSTDDDDGVGGPGDPGDYQTHVVSTTGGPCDWPEYAELKWDCVTSFASAYSSRIAFPDDFEDTGTMFVGVTDCDYCQDCHEPNGSWHGCGGDVYMVMDGSCIDMNVLGISSGCIGITPVDIISLDIEGDTDEASLIAGAFCDTNVYCSTDGGWSWDASAKDPTGDWLTYAIWYEDTALAVTAGCEAAVSMCCGDEYPCEFWNQISLISTDIDCVESIDHSPGYLSGDSETMFMLTKRCYDDSWCCWWNLDFDDDCGPNVSVFRYDGTYWERVLLPASGTDVFPFGWEVKVSPDFLDTNSVYVGQTDYDFWRTTDAGCSWTPLTFPCSPKGCISAWEVIDEDTVIAGGADGRCDADNTGIVFKTIRHGARPWDEYDIATTGNVRSFALEPGYEDPASILAGDDQSQVFISEDGGETWDLVGAAIDDPSPFGTWVVFDPAYATSSIIYAASDNTIARCVIDPEADWADQTWEEICPAGIAGYANGIQAAGDTALYVTDNNYTHCPSECCVPGVSDYGGVLRSLNPDTADAADVIFERLTKGLPADGGSESLRGLWLTTDTSDEGCVENVLWALEWDENCSICRNAGPDIWVWEDTLAAPVVLAMPVDGQKLGTTDSATLSWNALCGADCYEVALWKYCAECPDEKLEVDLWLDCEPGTCCVACGPDEVFDDCGEEGFPCSCTSDICIVVGPAQLPLRYDGYYSWGGLEPGTEYYWQVRVCQCKPVLSKWSEERSFMTALVQVVDLCSPECGGQDIILTPNFSWDAVDGATGYDIELAPTETFTAGVVRGSSTVNAWVAPEDLEYATTYYWRVRAEKDGVFSDWTVCIFTTMEEPVEPPPPVTITPAPPAPQINIPPAEMITPNWIYAIIGIGAALCVVVIVLIVRTRRPPA